MSGRHREDRRATTSEFGEVISTYSRRQAIEDGVLVDITKTAKEAGFRVPVALTQAVFEKYVRVPKAVRPYQDEQGRTWDILWMLGFAIRSAGKRGLTELLFELRVRNDASGRPKPVTLKAVSGPGDDGETVLTIMLPGED